MRAAASKRCSTRPASHRDRAARRWRRNVQYDSVSHKVLADVQTRNQVAMIDPRSNRVVRRISVPGCDSPHGLLIDSPRRLAFVACDGNARLLTLDSRR